MKKLSVHRVTVALAVGIAGTALVACGDSSNLQGPGPVADPGPALVSGTDVPVAATQDAAQALAFVRTVVAMEGEVLDPLRLGDAVLATSEVDDAAGDI